ncbi:hypothetical protein AnigIFM63309_011666 [Aspergillus niger]|nr:hypothetical protein AnigIFM63309_011666 [Aspergillus niger]
MTGTIFKLCAVDAQTTSVDEVVKMMKYHGGVIIRGLISEEVLEKVDNDIKPHFRDGCDNPLFHQKTRIVASLPNKSPAFVEYIVCNPFCMEVCDALLTSHHQAWMGDQNYTFDSSPIYISIAAFSTLPGNDAQLLHRDDMNNHAKRAAITPEEYTTGRDVIITTFFASTRTKKENGATRFIPGSHLQDTMERPDESQAVYVELERGDVFMVLGSCYHAASANVTEHEERVLYTVFTTNPRYRQFENIFLSLPLDKLRKFPPRIQKRLGFCSGNPISNWLDLRDMRMVLGLPEPNTMQQLQRTTSKDCKPNNV